MLNVSLPTVAPDSPLVSLRGREPWSRGRARARPEAFGQCGHGLPADEEHSRTARRTWLIAPSVSPSSRCSRFSRSSAQRNRAGGLQLRPRGVAVSGALPGHAERLHLTAAPATELRGIHAPFFTDVFFPPQPLTANYFGVLGGGGATQLHVTPVQHRSTSPTTMTRRESDLDLRLFYSGNFTSYCPGTSPLQAAPCTGRTAVTPALAAPPTITGVETSLNAGTLTFKVRVIGELVAGIQDVWVTWTILPAAGNTGTWAPVETSCKTLTTRRCGRARSAASRTRLPCTSSSRP